MGEEETSKHYLTDLAANVKTIQDDLIGEQMDVDSQVVQVKTAAMDLDWKKLKLSELVKFCRVTYDDSIITWESCEAKDLKVNDIISDKDGILKEVVENPKQRTKDSADVECRIIDIRLASADGTETKFLGDLKHTFSKIGEIEMGYALPAWKAINDVKDVAAVILQNTNPILVVAGPGTGKTWFLQQLCHMLLVNILEQDNISNNVFLPVLIPVQKLARFSRQETWNSKEHLDLIRSFFETEITQHAPLLKGKLAKGQLILLIDGVDEASGMRETIECLVVDSLLPTGNRIVVASRPEGVRLPLYYRNFGIFNLLPLSIKQQLEVIRRFTTGNEFLVSLFKMSKVRSEHDDTYEKHFTKNHKDEVESMEPFDRFKLENGEWDHTKRQSAIDGSEISETTVIKSSFLQTLQKGLDENNVLSRLEDELQRYVEKDNRIKDPDARKVVQKILENSPPALCMVCTRLCLLRVNTDQGKRDMQQLWNHIASRTDDLYVSAEHFLPIFEKLLSTLQEQCSKDDLQIVIGPMKDPIRVFEKAQCDYSNRFADEALPESCVVDLLRVRLICSKSGVIKKIWKVFQEGKIDCLDDNSVTRLKNMFHPHCLTPTHFRFMILSLQLADESARFMVEVQLQLKEILKKEAEADGHSAYAFFRSTLKDRYRMVLENALQSPRVEESLSRFESMAKVPVLLSLIVVILTTEGSEDPLGALQSSKYELYEKAMSCIIRRKVDNDKDAQAVMKMLELVSAANMRAQRRVFDLNDVRTALADENVGLFEKWMELEDSSSGIPLVKILSERSQSENFAEYQFKHLSFSEALYFKHLTSSETKISSDEAIKLIRDGLYLNTTRFGHADIARALYLHLQEHIALDGMAPESFENLKKIIRASPCEFDSLLGTGLYAGSGTHTVAAKKDKYRSGYSVKCCSSSSASYYDDEDVTSYKRITGGGVLYAMIEGDLQRVKDFVVADGNLPVETRKKSDVRSETKGVYVDGISIYERMDYDDTNDRFYEEDHTWDGETEPYTSGLDSLLELSIKNLPFPVARAIQDGLKERGEQYRIGTDRLLDLLKNQLK